MRPKVRDPLHSKTSHWLKRLRPPKFTSHYKVKAFKVQRIYHMDGIYVGSYMADHVKVKGLRQGLQMRVEGPHSYMVTAHGSCVKWPLRSGPLYTMTKDHSLKSVMLLETHLMAIPWKIDVGFCPAMGLQAQCKDIHSQAFNSILYFILILFKWATHTIYIYIYIQGL